MFFTFYKLFVTSISCLFIFNQLFFILGQLLAYISQLFTFLSYLLPIDKNEATYPNKVLRHLDNLPNLILIFLHIANECCCPLPFVGLHILAVNVYDYPIFFVPTSSVLYLFAESKTVKFQLKYLSGFQLYTLLDNPQKNLR